MVVGVESRGFRCLQHMWAARWPRPQLLNASLLAVRKCIASIMISRARLAIIMRGHRMPSRAPVPALLLVLGLRSGCREASVRLDRTPLPWMLRSSQLDGLRRLLWLQQLLAGNRPGSDQGPTRLLLLCHLAVCIVGVPPCGRHHAFLPEERADRLLLRVRTEQEAAAHGRGSEADER